MSAIPSTTNKVPTQPELPHVAESQFNSDIHRLLSLILERHAKSEWPRIAEERKYSTMDLLNQDFVKKRIQAFENEVKRFEPMLKHELQAEVETQLSTFLQEGGTFMQSYEGFVQNIRSTEARESARKSMTQIVQDVSTTVWPNEAKALRERPSAVEAARESFYARTTRAFDENMELAELKDKHSVQYEEALQNVMDVVFNNKFALFVQQLRTKAAHNLTPRIVVQEVHHHQPRRRGFFGW